MIGLRLPGWTRLATSGEVHFVAPEGAAAGLIRLRERVRPLTRFADLLRGRVPASDMEVVDGPRLVISQEGEHGSAATVRGVIDGVTWQRDVAILVGDEFCAAVIGVTRTPAHFDRTAAAVRSLIHRLPLWLGTRRRLILYPPPPGWRGVARGLDAEWYPPDFPATVGRLTVFPAIPARGASSEDALATLLDELRDLSPGLEEADWIESIRLSPTGLIFHCRSAAAAGRAVRIAAAVDELYLYAARLEGTTLADYSDVLEATLDGMVPIAPGAQSAAGAMAHWAG